MMKWEDYQNHEWILYQDREKTQIECPECGEPIYECDWDADDLMCCPVCDFPWEI